MVERIITGDLGVNTYLYNYDKKDTLIIDPGSDSDKILSRITYSDYNITGILLTHGHFDHVGAVKILKDKFKTKVYIHQDDSTFLGEKGSERHMEMFQSMGPGGTVYYNTYYVENDAADIILSDEDSISKFGLKVIHTPGHSPGSICLYSKKESILFSGDTLFKNGLGRTDLSGGNYQTLMNSLKKLSKLPKETVVYPGHGDQTTIQEENL